MQTSALEAWEFDPSCELSDVVQLVSERLAPPSFRGHLLSTRGDSLTVQVVEGSPAREVGALYYVGGHGAFVLARREVWPPAPGGTAERVLLTLRAHPEPQATTSAR